jgi:DNA-binding transcriptional MerR regulator
MNGTRYSIGEFARRCRLTVTTLRHYDATGVLAPSYVDPATGYRYYDDDQVVIGSWLAVLRELGVPVADLRSVGSGHGRVADVLADHRRRLSGRIDEQQRRLAVLDELMASDQTGDPVVRDVVVAERRLSSYAVTTSWDRAEAATRHGLARLEVLLRRAGVAPDAPKGAVFPADPDDRFVLRVYADVPCPSAAAGLSELVLPGGRCFETEVVGSRHLAGFAYRVLLAAEGAVGVEDSVSEDYEWCRDGSPLTRLRRFVRSAHHDGRADDER